MSQMPGMRRSKRQPRVAFGLLAAGALGASLLLSLASRGPAPSEGAPQAELESSTLAVLNPGITPVRVRVTYHGSAGTCQDWVVDDKSGPRTIEAAGIAFFDLADAQASGLPDGCRAAAVIEATGSNVVAVVVDEDKAGTSAGAYSAIPAGSARPRVALPRWRKGDGEPRRSSRVHLFALSGAAEMAVLDPLDAAGRPIDACGRPCTIVLSKTGTGSWNLAAVDALPEGKGGGSALVTAGSPIAALVEDRVSEGLGDVMLAAGLPVADGALRAPLPAQLPLALRAAENPLRAALSSAGFPWLRAAANQAGRGPAPDGQGAITEPGTSEIRAQNLSTTTVKVAADLYEQAGGAPQGLVRERVGAGAAAAFDLASETAFAPGAYAARVAAEGALAARVDTAWPRAGGAAAYVAPEAALLLVAPLIHKAFEGRSSLLTIQNTDTGAPLDVSIVLYAPAQTQPVLSTRTRIEVGRSVTLDLGADGAFANLPDGFRGWAQLRAAGGSAAAVVFESRGADGRAVYAYEAISVFSAAERLVAPLVQARWDPQQPPATATASPSPSATRVGPASATPTPSATAAEPTDETPSPGPSATETPVTPEILTSTPIPISTVRPTDPPAPRPTLDAKSGWSRPLGEGAAIAPVDRAVHELGLGADGARWFRTRGARAEDTIVLLTGPGAAPRVFDGLRAAVAAEYPRIRRSGTLSGFWAVDRQGRVWIGAEHFDGQVWRKLAADEAHPMGGRFPGAEALVDRLDQAWVPTHFRAECLRPQGCAARGLQVFTADGPPGEEIGLPDTGGAEGFGVRPLRFLSGRGATTASLASSGQGGDGAEGADQAGGQDWAVTPHGLYLLPATEPVVYPMLGPPAQAGRLRNAGHASASALGPDGRLVVFTWIELQRPSGVEHRALANTWLGNGWDQPVDLGGGTLWSPSLRFDRITAAAYALDGALWVGTSSGRVASRIAGRWYHLFTEANSPLPADGPIRAIEIDGTGTVYIASSDGVLAYQPGRIDTRTIALPLLVKP